MGDFNNTDSVVAIPERFQTKLGIGEDAFGDLRRRKNLRKALGVAGTAGAGYGGMAVASSATVASLFPAPGLLGVLGLGAATTPIGWVIAGGIGTGLAAMGIIKYATGGKKGKVAEYPEFTNTPLDELAELIFYYWAGLNLKVAFSDRIITDAERESICSYFVEEWGYSEKYIRIELPTVEKNIGRLNIEELTVGLIEYKKENPDCNYDSMAEELKKFLNRTLRSDGAADDQGLIIVKWIEERLSEEMY